MPRAGKLLQKMDKNVDYYEIAMRKFDQQILPTPLPATPVFGYGPVIAQNGPQIFNAPSLTIEARWNKPVRVKWTNELVDDTGAYVSHILPVDQTLHWANPPGGDTGKDTRGTDPTAYQGPVPIVTHVHGAHTYEESDGYPEAWYLPNASNIPGGYAMSGSFYSQFNNEYQNRYNDASWEPGTSVFQYPNDQRATTLWYHDHTLGMTRLNVYAGPAGFYIVRGGPDDIVLDPKGKPAILPGPAPALGDAPGTNYYEIPIVIQDRSFNMDGSLFFPGDRAFFEGLNINQLQIPFTPDPGCDAEASDVSPIWNPEFFGNMMMINGNTWPYLDVEQRRYRFRFLNGCNSRFLILDFSSIPGLEVWQIGAEGGFLPAPVNLTVANRNRLLLALAERADLIFDFTNVPLGNHVLTNIGPDEPFGGGEPGEAFEMSDPDTTGQIMQFRVGPALSKDKTTPPQDLVLPAITPLVATSTRQVSLNEEESKNVFVSEDSDGNIIFDCASPTPFGPTSALCGTLKDDLTSQPLKWMDSVTENPVVGSTETWEIYNFTADAHPIHVHLVQFQVVDRQQLETDQEGIAVQPAVLIDGTVRQPEVWETGFKDTVVAYPGEVTRIKARFDYEGLYVWHCHIVDHEDNEMMRPYRVVPPQA